MRYIAIDLGTTNIKAAIFDNNIQLLSQCSRRVSYIKHDDVVEFDALGYAASVFELIRNACAASKKAPAGEEYHMILTGQAESLVVLGPDKTPLCPGISWLDMRSRAECAELSRAFPKDACFPVTGQPEIIPTWPVTKILWLRRNRPDVFAKAFKYLLIKDYVVYCLTGLFAGEYSIYNFSHYFDIVHKRYWTDILRYCGVSADQLPKLYPPCHIAGTLYADAARELNLPADTKVNLGTLDHFAGMIGTGSFRESVVSASLGTVLSLAAVTDQRAFLQNTVPVHCGPLPDSYVYLPVCESGGISLHWFVDQLGGGESLAEIDRQCALQPRADHLIFLPYLTGANAPDYQLNARGVFYGLSAAHNRYQMATAVMEGVACMIRRNIEHFGGDIGIRRIVVTGGGAKSDLWCRLIADVTGREIAVPADSEAACLGAAMIGAVCEGRYPDYKTAADECVTMAKRFAPGADSGGYYERKYRLFEYTYSALQPVFSFDAG